MHQQRISNGFIGFCGHFQVSGQHSRRNASEG